MTQKDLAQAIGMSQAVVSAWVHNECKPSHAAMVAIVGALDTTLERFFGRVPKAKAAS